MEDFVTLLLSLLSLGLTFIPCCVFILIFVLILGGMIVLISKRLKPATPEEKTGAKNKGIAWLERQAPELARWQRHSLGELSASWQGTWSHMIGLEAKGAIHSLHTKEKMVAFFLYRRMRESFVLAETSDQKWEIYFAGGFAKIYLDGAAFGQWRMADGVMFNTQTEEIGTAKRKAGLDFFIEGFSPNWQDRFYPVRLHGREIGAINNAPEGANILRAFQDSGQPPLVAPAGSLLDRESEDWLLALAIIETVYYSVQERISAQRRMRQHSV